MKVLLPFSLNRNSWTSLIQTSWRKVQKGRKKSMTSQNGLKLGPSYFPRVHRVSGTGLTVFADTVLPGLLHVPMKTALSTILNT